MTRAYAIDTVRSIKKTISRFISIVVIVALGSGLFVGLNSVSTDMTESADDYYKTNNLLYPIIFHFLHNLYALISNFVIDNVFYIILCILSFVIYIILSFKRQKN